MTRARLDLSDFETPPSKDPAKLREISEGLGFPSRPAVSSLPPGTPRPVAAPALGAAPATSAEHPTAIIFQRPARQVGNRHITINTRVDPDTAQMIYDLRDGDPHRKLALADVIEEAVRLLYDHKKGGA